jgi:drug/metabolite transporter (DMT)-like permease
VTLQIRPTHLLAPTMGTAAVAMLWGSSGVLVREMTLSAAAIAFGRSAIGAVVLGLWVALPVCRTHRSAMRERWRGASAVLAWSGALLATHWLTLVMALQRAPMGTVLLGIYLAPLLIAVLAGRTLQESVSRSQAVTLTLAVCGCVLIFRPDQTGGWEGLALIAISAGTYAASIIVSKTALEVLPAVTVSACQLFVSAVLLSPLMAMDPVTPTGCDVLLISTLGLIYTGLAMLAYLAFLRDLPATTSGTMLYLEPVSAVVSGWLFLNERPGPLTLVGASLVVLAGAAAVWDMGQKGARRG